jgi:nicotinamide-nucleotide amidase
MSRMKAAILAVGSELLGTQRLDTNSLSLASVLERFGVELRRKLVVGDHEADLAWEIKRLLGEFELILVTGGLGPTADDVTRGAVAQALGRGLTLDPLLADGIAARFQRMGMVMPEVNRRQAEVIAGATILVNDRGTAPGLRLEADGSTIFLFPGVPLELAGMVERDLVPWLGERTGGESLETVYLKVACVSESALEERIAPAYEAFGRETITVLAKPGEIEVRVTARGEVGERRAQLERMRADLAERIGDAVFAFEEGATLEAEVGRLLAAQGKTLGTAESCTGGLLAERVTRVPGSSAYFLGAVVSYSNEHKVGLLGVPEALLAAHGAVSEAVARAMAEGGRARLGTDYCLAVTGVAGPGGGTAEKPVGTVHLALAGPGGPEDVRHRRLQYPVERERVRWMSSQWALEMLRRRLLAAP